MIFGDLVMIFGGLVMIFEGIAAALAMFANFLRIAMKHRSAWSCGPAPGPHPDRRHP